MENFKELLRKRFSEQYRGKNMIWSLAMNEIKSHLKVEKIDPEIQEELVTGYVRYNKLFIKTINQDLKIKVFKEKSEILKKINNKLSEVGYKAEINDIILK